MEGVLAWSKFHLVDPFWRNPCVFLCDHQTTRRCVTKQSTHQYITMRTTRFCMCMGVTKQKSALHYENDYQSLTSSPFDLSMCRHTSKLKRSARWSWRSTYLQRRDNRSGALLLRRASQFDPAINEERKLISNLRRNMPVLPDISECVALRADMKGDQLNSLF